MLDLQLIVMVILGITLEASGANLYSLEIDHNFEVNIYYRNLQLMLIHDQSLGTPRRKILQTLSRSNLFKMEFGPITFTKGGTAYDNYLK